jgi:hypothetical protein
MPWDNLVKLVANDKEMGDEMKYACIAQAIHESGRGVGGKEHGYDKLPRIHHNYWGMKWRPEMVHANSRPAMVQVGSEKKPEKFCSFNTDEDGIKGWRAFIKRSPYKDWEKYQDSACALLLHLSECGWASGTTGDPGYGLRVGQHLPEAIGLVNNAKIKH